MCRFPTTHTYNVDKTYVFPAPKIDMEAIKADIAQFQQEKRKAVITHTDSYSEMIKIKGWKS